MVSTEISYPLLFTITGEINEASSTAGGTGGMGGGGGGGGGADATNSTGAAGGAGGAGCFLFCAMAHVPAILIYTASTKIFFSIIWLFFPLDVYPEKIHNVFKKILENYFFR
jgi:hypothetical protein